MTSHETTIFAHSRPEAGPETWETLADHARAVAACAERHAEAFGAGSFGALAGWRHDLGKMKPPFQRRIRGAPVEVSHSGEGARLAHRLFGPLVGQVLAYVIAGHHAGLPNGARTSTHRPPTPLSRRLA